MVHKRSPDNPTSEKSFVTNTHVGSCGFSRTCEVAQIEHPQTKVANERRGLGRAFWLSSLQLNPEVHSDHERRGGEVSPAHLSAGNHSRLERRFSVSSSTSPGSARQQGLQPQLEPGLLGRSSCSVGFSGNSGTLVLVVVCRSGCATS